MSRKREVRIQSALLMILLPVLFLTTTGFGYLLYSKLYQEILVGFDARLRAVSTITGAFIDGDRHLELLGGYRPAALASSPDGRSIFAVDGEGRLLRLDPETGSASPFGSVPALLSDMAWDAENDRLIGIEDKTGLLHLIDPKTCRAAQPAQLAKGLNALAWESFSGKFYAAGGHLVEVDPIDFSSRQIASFEGFRLDALSQGSSPGTLVGLTDSSPRELVLVHLPEGNVSSRVPLQALATEAAAAPDSGKSKEEDPEVMVRGLARSSGPGKLWTLGESLGTIDPADGQVEFFGYPGFRDENGGTYQAYIGPMRRIREGVGLTYLYTFVLSGEDREQIVYVLDANLDEDHSRIGDVDADPAETGTIRVFKEGGVNLSEIEYWEQWGLIKSADAPIYHSDGTIAALAGADINVSVINEKTRSALAKVLLTGLLCVLIASVAVVKVSNSLVRPIEELKQQALKVAAGDFGQKVRVDRPAELRELAEGFNEMSAALKETVEGLSESNLAMERERQRAELVLTIAKRTDVPVPAIHPSVLCGRSSLRATRRDASGWIVRGKFLYCWFANGSPADPFEAVRLRSDLWSLVKSLAEKKQDDWPAMRQFLDPLFHEVVDTFLRLDLEHLHLRGMSRGRLRIAVLSEAGTIALKELGDDLDVAPADREQLLVVGPDCSALLESLEARPPKGNLKNLQAIQDAFSERNGRASTARTDHLILTFWRER